MSIEAMKQALEALEEVQKYDKTSEWFDKKISALRQAIAEAEKQEPVAWMSVDCVGERYLHFSKPLDNDPVQPIYTAPVHASDMSQERVHISDKHKHEFECPRCGHCCPEREWVGLTDEEVDEWTPEIHNVIRAIEAKLKEKNA
jgi:hypothetical protein